MAICEETLRRQLVSTSRQVWERGWVANHDGNLTARLDAERLLCTPTAVSKGSVSPEMLIVVDSNNTVLTGTRRAFSELALHRAAYAARPDIGVCIHAHPPTATGFAVAGVALGHPFMAEPVVTLGACLPTVPLMLPGDAALPGAIAKALAQADVALLEGHGVLAVGGSFEQALLRLELVEHLAKIALVAKQLGGARPLPRHLVERLTAKGRPPSVPDHTSTAPSAGPVPSAGPAPHRPDVRSVVEDALRRLR